MQIADNSAIEDYSQYSDQELLESLKANWGYPNRQPLEVIGRLQEIQTDLNAFFVLEDLHSSIDGSNLQYPPTGSSERTKQNIFIGSLNGVGFKSGSWVKVIGELSPKSERIKRSNPFALQARSSSLRSLQRLPETMAGFEHSIGNDEFVESWILEFYREQYKDRIKNQDEALRQSLLDEQERQKARVSEITIEADSLDELVTERKGFLQDLEGKLSELNGLREETESEFSNRKKFMERQLDKLNSFVERKAEMLLQLDLVDEAEIEGLLGRGEEGITKAGHDFHEVFSSSQAAAVGYIQAHLHRKGIMYNRKVLEDFFALLTTHDLIVLAGDSGSGKTNLVKSFAAAIGGEAVIIPVKPNWTSAEDLLGYYNPIEQSYLSTPFLDALFEARRNPEVPYFICLDEMNLARVEYYFADFLSLMEERSSFPEIQLYSGSESSHLVSEARNFLALIDDVKANLDKSNLTGFLDLLRDPEVNGKLHEICGFHEGESLLRYHARLRKLMSSYLSTPSSVKLPPNVRIMGAINVDETTHYLSPKILDRAHIIRFGSPLLKDWEEIDAEVETFDLDMELPLNIDIRDLGNREDYPVLDRESPLVKSLLHLVKEYLEPLGIEFGLRTIRQSLLYKEALEPFEVEYSSILNNIVLHKILPKLMFDGEKKVDGSISRKDLLIHMKDYLDQELGHLDEKEVPSLCVAELERVIRNAETNDWVVNYWTR